MSFWPRSSPIFPPNTESFHKPTLNSPPIQHICKHWERIYDATLFREIALIQGVRRLVWQKHRSFKVVKTLRPLTCGSCDEDCRHYDRPRPWYWGSRLRIMDLMPSEKALSEPPMVLLSLNTWRIQCSPVIYNMIKTPYSSHQLQIIPSTDRRNGPAWDTSSIWPETRWRISLFFKRVRLIGSLTRIWKSRLGAKTKGPAPTTFPSHCETLPKSRTLSKREQERLA